MKRTVEKIVAGMSRAMAVSTRTGMALEWAAWKWGVQA